MYVRPGEWYRRPSMCFVVDLHVTTAVLIHLLGGHLLVDDTLASWADVLRRRYWYMHLLGGHLLVDDTLTYTCLLVGHTCYDGDTSTGRTTPLVWRYTYTCLLVGHTCYDGDTSAGRTTPLGTLRILSISMGRTSLRWRYTYTSYLGGRLVWIGHTLLAGRWYLSRRTCLPGRTSLRRRYTYTSYLGGRLVWTYITCWAVIPFSADLPAWADNSLVACVLVVRRTESSQQSDMNTAMAIYRRCIRIEELCEDFEFNNKLK